MLSILKVKYTIHFLLLLIGRFVFSHIVCSYSERCPRLPATWQVLNPLNNSYQSAYIVIVHLSFFTYSPNLYGKVLLQKFK